MFLNYIKSFRYGLVGNTIHYGGMALALGYTSLTILFKFGF
jgi:hypothetical protein